LRTTRRKAKETCDFSWLTPSAGLQEIFLGSDFGICGTVSSINPFERKRKQATQKGME
jgi:hypothetical protein